MWKGFSISRWENFKPAKAMSLFQSWFSCLLCIEETHVNIEYVLMEICLTLQNHYLKILAIDTNGLVVRFSLCEWWVSSDPSQDNQEASHPWIMLSSLDSRRPTSEAISLLLFTLIFLYTCGRIYLFKKVLIWQKKIFGKGCKERFKNVKHNWMGEITERSF